MLVKYTHSEDIYLVIIFGSYSTSVFQCLDHSVIALFNSILLEFDGYSISNKDLRARTAKMHKLRFDSAIF